MKSYENLKVLIKCRDGVHWGISQSAIMEKHWSSPQGNQPQMHQDPQESSSLLEYWELLSSQVLTEMPWALTSVFLVKPELCRTPDCQNPHPGLAEFLALFGDAPRGADCPVRLLTLWHVQSEVRQIAEAIVSVLQTAKSAHKTKDLIWLGDVGKCFPDLLQAPWGPVYCSLLERSDTNELSSTLARLKHIING